MGWRATVGVLSVAAAVTLPTAGIGPAAAGSSTAKATHAATASKAQQLKAAIARAISGSSARHVAWRFDVQGIGHLSHHPGAQSRPASNNKLLVAQTGLQLLGANHAWTTTVEHTGTVIDGRLHGSLVVLADGDPTLGTPQLRRLARAVSRSGIRQVNRGLVIDDGNFEHRTTAPGWLRGFTPDDVGPIDGFAVDGDGWRGDSSYLAHTATANGGRFRRVLRNWKIRMHGRVRTGSPAADAPLAEVTSPSLGRVVDAMLTESINFDAEMLLDDLGGLRGAATRRNGLKEVGTEAATLGVRLHTDVDGSGLSYSDRESPTSLVGWLEASQASEVGAQLRAALPVSCESGTLVHRLCGSASRGRVQAKTGTLSHTSTLSGYTTTASGRAVTFSVMLDGVGSIDKAVAKIDGAVAAVDRFNS